MPPPTVRIPTTARAIQIFRRADARVRSSGPLCSGRSNVEPRGSRCSCRAVTGDATGSTDTADGLAYALGAAGATGVVAHAGGGGCGATVGGTAGVAAADAGGGVA